MNLSSDERPIKKRRFFAVPSSKPAPAPAVPGNHGTRAPTEEPSKIQNHAAEPNDQPKEPNDQHNEPVQATPDGHTQPSFDAATFADIIGEELSAETLNNLSDASSGNMERAINMYLDGSFKKITIHHTSKAFGSLKPMMSKKKLEPSNDVFGPGSEGSALDASYISPALNFMPEKRYLGAFGVEAWATRSGVALRFDEKVKIERQKIQSCGLKRKNTAGPKQRKTQDLVVRFTNSKGQEVGRLPQDSASFVSTLIDEDICFFEGVCVYAPDAIRTNDSIYLQLRCFLLRKAFQKDIRPLDNNRLADLFAAKETEDERILRLRQVALVKLFTAMHVEPVSTNGHFKNKRTGILQAAEKAEQDEAASVLNTPGPSSPGEEGKELEQDQLDALYKKAQSFDFDTPEAEPADSFAMQLRPYQKQALHWLLTKEQNNADRRNESMHPLWEEYAWPAKDEQGNEVPKIAGVEKFYVNPYSGELSVEFPRQEHNCLGGILADEMGLGKTIEMLSLIHSHKSEALQNSLGSDFWKCPGGTEPAPFTTLVVAPMSLIAQWQLETDAASKPGTMSSYVHYGNDKASLKDLCSVTNGTKAPNVVITSYGTVLSEYNQFTAAAGSRTTYGGLFSLNFFRVILDEAHHIKNRMSKTARACYELNADHRWVLTGTPIVNRLEDLFSLVRFLRVAPWDNFSFFKTFITLPFESKDFIRALNVVQTVLEPLVLRRTKDMRRPDGLPLVPLPTKTTIIEKVKLSKRERELYDHIRSGAKKSFTYNLQAGTVMKAYTSILAQILRLRQACCHPTLIKKKEVVEDELEAEAAYDAANGLSDDMDINDLIDRFSDEQTDRKAASYGSLVLQQIRDEVDNECPFCYEEPMNQMVVTGCFHAACKDCLLKYIEHEREQGKLPLCVTCREPINERDVFEVIREDIDGDDNSCSQSQQEIILRRVLNSSSAKVDALVAKLKQIRKTEPVTKSCVFSQFTSFLSILEPVLQRERIPYVRFDGSMQQQARAEVLNKFRLHDGGMVLLISLRAGGVGLNLTEASRVFMADPWWSYAVEAQAIDRIHRMGQTREVTVHRFIVEDSVEEKMVNKIQARKKIIASSLGMMNDEEKRQQRLEDIKDLLSD